MSTRRQERQEKVNGVTKTKQTFSFIFCKDTDSFINALQRDQYSQSCKRGGQFKQSILNSDSETSMQT